MNEILADLSGWIPAVILPVASLIQLVKIYKSKSSDGVSPLAWTLFGVANIGLYIFTEKYLAFQSIIGLLGTSLINFYIVGMTYYYRKK